MSIYDFLQLQPVEPQPDGQVSALDEYKQDETIDLTHDITEQELDEKFDLILEDLKHDDDKLNFSDSNE